MRERWPALLIGCVLLAQVAAGAAPSTGAVDEAVGSDELRGHVTYLASRELRGRAPRTPSSSRAREYIVAAFERIGLQPWPGEASLEQRMLFGANIVGVLPGGDEAVADEIVIVSAHYDHLGAHDGELHPGAADNAAGVAALIELAEALAVSPYPTRRTICFAAYDAEEEGLLGSFAFAAREDVKPAKLAGVVNMDTLGRWSFDVLEETICAAGTERYPGLRRAILDGARDMQVLLTSRNLVGPRSDHVPFEPRNVPWVFFTSGPYGDYHKPTDTPERIDYAKLQRETCVVRAAVEALADAAQIEKPREPVTGDRMELASARAVLTALVREPKAAGVPESQLPALRRILREVHTLDSSPEFSLARRDALIADLFDAMASLTAPGQHLPIMRRYAELYNHAPQIFIPAWQAMVAHLTAHPPGLLGGPSMRDVRSDVGPQTVLIEPASDGRLTLRICATQVRSGVNYGLLFHVDPDLRVNIFQVEVAGTPAELLDWCALKLLATRDDLVTEAVRHVVARLEPALAAMEPQAFVTSHISAAGATHAHAWVRQLAGSGRGPVAHQALATLLALPNAATQPGLTAIATNREADPLLRLAAIDAAARRWPKDSAEHLAGLLRDHTVIPPRRLTLEGSPFAHRLMARTVREASKGDPKTIAHAAHRQLTAMFKTNVGNKPADWLVLIASKSAAGGSR